MVSVLIKEFVPVLIVVAWIIYSFRVQKARLVGAGLFIASYAAFSSNFTFIYRELHQAIQLFLIVAIVLPSIMRGRFLRLNFIFLILFGLIGISLIYAPFDVDAKSQLINLLVSVGVVNYLFASLRSPKDLEKVLQLLAVLSLLLACVGWGEYLFSEHSRIETTFSNPNYFGFFVGVGSCVVLATWAGWRKYAAAILIVTALILSGSRSAIVFPLLQLLWIVYRGKGLQKTLLFTVVLLLVAVSLEFSNTRFTNLHQTEGSDAERVIFARIALRMVNDHPLTGVGWGRFVSEFGHYSTRAEGVITSLGVTDVSNQVRRVTHNDYLRILAELGWFAFVLAVGSVVNGVRIIFVNRSFELDCLLPIYVGVLLFSLAHNNLNSAFFWFFFLIPFFLNSTVLGKCMASRNKSLSYA